MRPTLTTASTHEPRPIGRRPLVVALAALLAAVWVATGVAPVDRVEWLLEQLLPVAAVLFLVGSYRRLQLSDLSYAAVALFLALHLVGARHGYEHTPAGAWLQAALGTTRNPYDRVVHLAFGVLASYPVRELLLWRTGRRRLAASYLTLERVLAASAAYELLEWGAARLLAPELGQAFVGAQGDPWDAQHDVALALLGALASLAGVEAAHRARAAWRARRGLPALRSPRPPWLDDGGERRRAERRHAGGALDGAVAGAGATVVAGD